VIATAFCLFIAISFSLDVSDYFNRTWVFFFALSTTILIISSRLLGFFIISFMAAKKLFARNVIIVGSGVQAEKLINQIEREKPRLNNIIGIFDDRIERAGPTVCGYPVLGNLEDLQKYIRKTKVDDVFITLPWSADERVYQITRKLRELPVHIHLSSDMIG
jgi:putative colanic acid biosysnthesis UDP-glucose lipid carrier transferase